MTHKFFAKTLFIGKKVYSLSDCHSTNEEASRFASENNELEGTVVLTDYQNSGRGQRGNSWESEQGKNIIISIILKPTFVSPSNQFTLHTVCSLAIYDTLFPYLGNKLRIKWPNDIYYEDRKLCGILIENTIRGQKIDTAIIGIGLNVNQLNFNTEHASSLNEIVMQEFDRWKLTEMLLLNFEKRYLQLKNNKYNQLKESYTTKLYKLNEQHFYMSEGEKFIGEIKGVSEQGKLLVERDSELCSFDFKEIAFLRA